MERPFGAVSVGARHSAIEQAMEYKYAGKENKSLCISQTKYEKESRRGSV